MSGSMSSRHKQQGYSKRVMMLCPDSSRNKQQRYNKRVLMLRPHSCHSRSNSNSTRESKNRSSGSLPAVTWASI